jgi:hypothetical protein
MLIAALPWNLIREIVMGILEEVVESTDNEYDDTLLDIVNGAIDKKEVDEPDMF